MHGTMNIKGDEFVQHFLPGFLPYICFRSRNSLNYTVVHIYKQ
jgi:hypothetical protein